MITVGRVSNGHLYKHVFDIIATINDSMEKNIPVKFTSIKKIKDCPENKVAVSTFFTLSEKKEKESKKIRLITQDNQEVIIEDMVLPEESSFSRVLFSIALLNKLLKKNDSVTVNDLKETLNSLRPISGHVKEKSFESENKIGKDKIEFKFVISEPNMALLLDMNYRKRMERILIQLKNKANSEHFTKWAMLLYKNNFEDNISITTDNFSSDKKTTVIINGTEIDINSDPKKPDIEKFAGCLGGSFYYHQKLWNTVFGISVHPVASEYNKLYFERKVDDAQDKVLSFVVSKVQTLLSGADKLKTLKQIHVSLNAIKSSNSNVFESSDTDNDPNKFYDVLKEKDNIKLKLKKESGAYSLVFSSDSKDLVTITLKEEKLSTGQSRYKFLFAKTPELKRLQKEINGDSEIPESAGAGSLSTDRSQDTEDSTDNLTRTVSSGLINRARQLLSNSTRPVNTQAGRIGQNHRSPDRSSDNRTPGKKLETLKAVGRGVATTASLAGKTVATAERVSIGIHLLSTLF